MNVIEEFQVSRPDAELECFNCIILNGFEGGMVKLESDNLFDRWSCLNYMEVSLLSKKLVN